MDLARTWSFCIWIVADSEDHVSPDFRRRIISSYLQFVLALGGEPSEISPRLGGDVQGLEVWRDFYLRELKNHFISGHVRRESLKDAFVSLDRGKKFIFDGYDWLGKELFGQGV
jgi:hypothetical protein